MKNQDNQVEEGPQFLHKNLVITSDKQRSSQGTVFYFKFNSLDQNGDQDKSIESILKIYPQNELETYDKEEKIIRQLQDRQFPGFPKIFSSIKGATTAEMILEALGPNLRHLLEASPKRHFSKATTLLIGIQLIERIRDLHSLGWMHNDIKLENILIGYKDPAKIYLIDFGLSQPFVDFQTGHHVSKVNLSYFSGNFMFASLNSCRGNNKSKRDDIESIFYLMIYLYNNNYLPWRDFKGTFKQMIVQRLQLRVTKSLFKMIPPCLEECLKYVLLLNFDEEPKYNYLIDQLKNAYFNEMAASGEKINPNAIKQPVFEWNVSLATKFNKAQQELDSQWMQGERALSLNNMDIISTSLMKSRLYLNFNCSNYDSSNNGSANMKIDNSPIVITENRQMLEQIAQLSQGSDNLDSGNLVIRRPLFQRNGSFNQNNSKFSKFKPFKDVNRNSHSPMQSRHNLIDSSIIKQRGSNKNNSSDTFSDDGGNRNRQLAVRKSSFYGQARLTGQLNVKKNSSTFLIKSRSGKNNSGESEQKIPSDQAEMLNSKSQESFTDEEEDSDYITPRNDVTDLRKQLKNNILIQELESSNQMAGQSTNDQTQTSYGQANIPSQELDEKINQYYYIPTQQFHQNHQLLQTQYMTQEQLQQQQLIQQQILQQQLQQQLQMQQQQQQQQQFQEQQQLQMNPHLSMIQNQQNYQLLLQHQHQQQMLQQQLMQQQLLQQQQQQFQQQQVQQQLQQQFQQHQQQHQQQQMIHPLIQQLPTPNFAAALQSSDQPEPQNNQNFQTQPYFRVMKVHQNDLKVRGSGGTNSPMSVKQPANNIDDDTMMTE